MGNQHQRGPPLLVEVEQQVADALAGAAVQIAGGFVGEQQAGLGGEGAGNGDPLLLAAGQLPWVMTQALAQADPLQQFGGSLAAPGWGDLADWWHRVRDSGDESAAAVSIRRRFGFLEDLVPTGPAGAVRRAAATIAKQSDV